MIVRPEQPGDSQAIYRVHAVSFPTEGEARLVDLLRTSGHLLVSLVAEERHEIVGHIAASPVTTASGHTGGGIGPVAVVESHRRKGIGEELVRQSLGECRRTGIGWVVVLGDPAYYGRFGFRPASYFGLSDEYGGGDAFQAMELDPCSLPRNGGVVRYAPAFATLA